jgi:hypothetical protein
MMPKCCSAVCLLYIYSRAGWFHPPLKRKASVYVNNWEMFSEHSLHRKRNIHPSHNSEISFATNNCLNASAEGKPIFSHGDANGFKFSRVNITLVAVGVEGGNTTADWKERKTSIYHFRVRAAI